MEYKVEIKPSFWVVTLESGCYSDWRIKYLFFRGNSEEEIWNFLCRYAKGEMDNKDEDKCGLMWERKKFQFKKSSWRKYEEDEMSWESDYGDAYEVRIERMKVVEFQI